MRQLITGVALVILAATLHAQNYLPADSGSEVRFTIKNFGLNVSGSFKGLHGKVYFQPGNPVSAYFMTTVDASSINTGNDARDNHLRKEEYLDVHKFPVISFSSTRVTRGAAGSLVMDGNITIKGITKPVSFPFTATTSGSDLVLTGSFKLNRRDFGVGGSSILMADNLVVSLLVLARKA
jgi:polyisoprenoid-binding protein YceI